MVHWSKMLDRLETQIRALGSPPLARHAWEIVRLSGLPLPSEIVDGNPFTVAPKVLEEKHWLSLSSVWMQVVNGFVGQDPDPLGRNDELDFRTAAHGRGGGVGELEETGGNQQEGNEKELFHIFKTMFR